MQTDTTSQSGVSLAPYQSSIPGSPVIEFVSLIDLISHLRTTTELKVSNCQF